MMDEREDRQDAWLQDAAKDYNAPPPTPKAEMWQRIEAARRQAAVTPIRRAPRWQIPLAVAAILTLGVAIGRFTSPTVVPTVGPIAPPGVTAAAPRTGGSSVASRLVTTDHLSEAETFLTEFGSQPGEADFGTKARSLLGTTRLLLDSRRVVDPTTRQLLEDLELVLVQIATIDPKDRSEDLGFITEGLAQNHLRTRLRNAIPAGPAIRL